MGTTCHLSASGAQRDGAAEPFLPQGDPKVKVAGSPRVDRPSSLTGWAFFKQWSNNRAKWGGQVDQRVEDAVYVGLRPAPAVVERIAAAQAALGLRAGEYGCVHARIERDMARDWPSVRAGRPPPLERYLDGASRELQLNATAKIFVAVGLDLQPQDKQTLELGVTAAGAALVRVNSANKSATRPARNDKRGVSDDTPISYTESALVDFFVARQAAWFMGFSGSTFARMLARLQALDHQRGWWAVCPEGVSHVAANSTWFASTWALCKPTGSELNYTYSRCSVGVCDPCCNAQGHLYRTNYGYINTSTKYGAHYTVFTPPGSLWMWGRGR